MARRPLGVKAVFHHSNDDADLHHRLVGNIANLLEDSIDTEAVAVVTNSGGLALVKENSPERERVAALIERGVAFKQCENTIAGTDTDEEDLIDGVELVPAGVGELTRLQDEGYAYIKP